MPRRDDLHTILILGSGPIVIGQACEFDYSGTQACKALKEEGFRVVLVNSNPATIMTDPEMADATYVEPLTAETVARIIERERPDALLPTVGGQTALNLAIELGRGGILERHGVELIGAKLRAIEVSEDRKLFKEAMTRIGLEVPASGYAGSLPEAEEVLARIGYPAVIRPSFTLGGSGGGVAYNVEEFHEIVGRGLALSPVGQVLIEESVVGWKEFELEVMRDLADNVVIICSIENLDPMGVHTGDSITVAPALTLTDVEYQRMRTAAIRIIREVGVETGGSNIQFAVDPATGRQLVIEMNPRVSRSSALASKATGFPIARIAAKLAVGYTLDEIPNDITRETPASFEPTIDYVVVKIPRFAFEKFPRADRTLTTQMKSVGEAMAIGRTFKEALQKGLRSLEMGEDEWGWEGSEIRDPLLLRERLITPTRDRLAAVRTALLAGMRVGEIAALTRIDPWFLEKIREIVAREAEIKGRALATLPRDLLRQAKRDGFSDRRLARLMGESEENVRARRIGDGIVPAYKRVDSCGAEFEAKTPYLYSTYEEECESDPSSRRKVMILGSGPNRIGQGIEFDYCCCQAAFALREEGFETIMVNCNPETVSTDYDTSDRLYFEPLTFEDVKNIVERERPEGVIVQFGGQTPLNLALALQRSGVPILGTSPESIDLAEDRKRFASLARELEITVPAWGTAHDMDEALAVAAQIGYPVLIRPSYVLGGRAMMVAYDETQLLSYASQAARVSPGHPVFIDRFLEDAFEVDVDAIGDGSRVVIGGILQHIEEAGIHSGDSFCVLPTYKITPEHLAQIRDQTVRMGLALSVRGLMNVQFAVKDGVLYVLEVNPRASRTVPFVSKATGVPLARHAARIMAGRTLRDLGFTEEPVPPAVFVKGVVFPFIRFPGEDPILGPEMKSTGEVMGISPAFGQAFAKAQMACGMRLPTEGKVFISVNDYDKEAVIPIGRGLAEMGFRLTASAGTAHRLAEAGLAVEMIYKVNEGRPNIVDRILNGDIQLILNTPLGRESHFDEESIRRTATSRGVPCITTLSGGAAAVEGIRALRQGGLDVAPLQAYHRAAPRP
ncbi:MAG TPA: carbamoyl-phosphate synthase large subunit [Candidatus Polarisedimenticolia bacterium]|nr:carbamoyl-phosphate synthase large subunit [Candidatus Polarisedimenticolia bacterium]